MWGAISKSTSALGTALLGTGAVEVAQVASSIPTEELFSGILQVVIAVVALAKIIFSRKDR